jgi:hypothetical protein
MWLFQRLQSERERMLHMLKSKLSRPHWVTAIGLNQWTERHGFQRRPVALSRIASTSTLSPCAHEAAEYSSRERNLLKILVYSSSSRATELDIAKPCRSFYVQVRSSYPTACEVQTAKNNSWVRSYDPVCLVYLSTN